VVGRSEGDRGLGVRGQNDPKAGQDVLLNPLQLKRAPQEFAGGIVSAVCAVDQLHYVAGSEEVRREIEGGEAIPLPVLASERASEIEKRGGSCVCACVRERARARERRERERERGEKEREREERATCRNKWTKQHPAHTHPCPNSHSPGSSAMPHVCNSTSALQIR
jgi:hypothetical protein